jgi:Spy/CpxP family protein refolding chaperone
MPLVADAPPAPPAPPASSAVGAAAAATAVAAAAEEDKVSCTDARRARLACKCSPQRPVPQVSSTDARRAQLAQLRGSRLGLERHWCRRTPEHADCMLIAC